MKRGKVAMSGELPSGRASGRTANEAPFECASASRSKRKYKWPIGENVEGESAPWLRQCRW